MISGLINR